MPGDVADEEVEGASRRLHDVVVVAPRLLRGLLPGGQTKPGRFRELSRTEVLLDLPRELDLALHPLPLQLAFEKALRVEGDGADAVVLVDITVNAAR